MLAGRNISMKNQWIDRVNKKVASDILATFSMLLCVVFNVAYLNAL